METGVGHNIWRLGKFTYEDSYKKKNGGGKNDARFESHLDFSGNRLRMRSWVFHDTTSELRVS